jgi:GntR family transcriptional repressor for pyruvate dehydrogenase complex
MEQPSKTRTDNRAVDRVVKEIESRVLDATWPPETKIPSERLLAVTWTVSRSTIREAIQRLAARGMLVSRHGSGVFVTDRSRSRLASPWWQLLAERPVRRAETLEFRRVIECAMAHFAAERASPDEQRKMGEIVERMSDAVRRRDVEAEADADAEFHAALAAASHNAMFSYFNTSVITMLREHITLNTFDATLDEASSRRRTLARLAQHKKIYEAVRGRKPDAASRAMQAHIDFVGRQFDSESCSPTN